MERIIGDLVGDIVFVSVICILGYFYSDLGKEETIISIISIFVIYTGAVILKYNNKKEEFKQREQEERIKFQKDVETLKTNYKRALKSGEKQRALVAGRRYYSKLRKGELTLCDEQAIANDLSAMNEIFKP